MFPACANVCCRAYIEHTYTRVYARDKKSHKKENDTPRATRFAFIRAIASIYAGPTSVRIMNLARTVDVNRVAIASRQNSQLKSPANFFGPTTTMRDADALVVKISARGNIAQTHRVRVNVIVYGSAFKPARIRAPNARFAPEIRDPRDPQIVARKHSRRGTANSRRKK